jgi:hypothetical protein
MSEYKGRIALGGLLVVALTVGLAFELNSSIAGVTGVGTSSSTQTSTQAKLTIGASSSTVDPKNGLRLSTTINATEFTTGQKLNISTSILNTRASANSFFPQRSFEYSAPGEEGNWTFYGVPIAAWPECSSQFPFGWTMPIEVVVLKGNYSAQELTSIANTTFSLSCGDIAGIIPDYTFQPTSDMVNVTVLAGGGAGYRTVGLFPLASSFVVRGYWNASALASNGPSVCEPAVQDVCTAPPDSPFTPGVYTVGVADEWGQFNLLHFRVTGVG